MLTNLVRFDTFQTVPEEEFHVYHNGKVKKTSKCHGSPYRTPSRVYIETTSNQLFLSMAYLSESVISEIACQLSTLS